MALPVAHFSVAFGVSRGLGVKELAFLACLSVLPDFDFGLVWGAGMPIDVMHRTWSHSLPFALVLTLAWYRFRPGSLSRISCMTFFLVLASHGFLDLFCVLDASDHGVMLFWPLSSARFGWPALVPLYLQWAESPFSLYGIIRYTLLELLLAAPLWAATRFILHMSKEVWNWSGAFSVPPE